MPREKSDDLPRLIVPDNATPEQICARIREAFTAADLQKYTEPLNGVSVDGLLEELEAIQRAEEHRQGKQS